MAPKKRAPKKSSIEVDPSVPFAAESFLAQFTQDLPGASKKKKPRRSEVEREAQELFYRAMECNLPDEQYQMLQKVLKLDENHVDAATALLRHKTTSPTQKIAMLRTIVEQAAKQLGKSGFREYAGHFWGFLETRPYMRARMELAEALRETGYLAEAVKEYEGLLDLNPNDNQGVRFELFTAYLELNELGGVRRLLKDYKDSCDFSVTFSWGRVLERLLSGDEPGALKALGAARKQNPHIEVYLKGHRRVTKNLPYSYALGSKEEALCFARPLLKAWGVHPQAQSWLNQQSANQ